MKNKLLYLILLVLLVRFSTTAQPNTNHDFVENSILSVQVHAQGEVYAATGFLWEDNSTLVTCFHVLKAGYTKIKVVDIDGYIKDAKVVRIHKNADLMLLKIDKPREKWRPYKSINQIVSREESLTVYGIPEHHERNLKIKSRTTFKVDVLPPPSTLENYIEQDQQKLNIAANGFPKLDMLVVGLDKTLAPGYSGSPIVNQRGEIVAVGDGAIDKGVYNESWAIAATYLAEMMAGSRFRVNPDLNHGTLSTYVSQSSGDKPTNDLYNFFAGTSEFEYVKTRSVQQILATGETNEVLGEVLDAYAGKEFGLNELVFDIYQHTESGEAFVIPAESKLNLDNGLLTGYEYGKRGRYAVEFSEVTTMDSFRSPWNESIKPRQMQESLNLTQYPSLNHGQIQTEDILISKRRTGDAVRLEQYNGFYFNEKAFASQGKIDLKGLDTDKYFECLNSPNLPGCGNRYNDRLRLNAVMAVTNALQLQRPNLKINRQ